MPPPTHPSFAVNMVVNVMAILVFVVLMAAHCPHGRGAGPVLFWWVIGSNEMLNAVQRKGKMLSDVRRALDDSAELRDGVSALDHLMRSGRHRLDREPRCVRTPPSRRTSVWPSPRRVCVSA